MILVTDIAVGVVLVVPGAVDGADSLRELALVVGVNGDGSRCCGFMSTCVSERTDPVDTKRSILVCCGFIYRGTTLAWHGDYFTDCADMPHSLCSRCLI